jgi:hypothetical protein
MIFKLLQDLLAQITYANILVYNIGSAFGVVKDLKRIRKWAQTGRQGYCPARRVVTSETVFRAQVTADIVPRSRQHVLAAFMAQLTIWLGGTSAEKPM